jgi:hypothetical protein
MCEIQIRIIWQPNLVSGGGENAKPPKCQPPLLKRRKPRIANPPASADRRVDIGGPAADWGLGEGIKLLNGQPRTDGRVWVCGCRRWGGWRFGCANWAEEAAARKGEGPLPQSFGAAGRWLFSRRQQMMTAVSRLPDRRGGGRPVKRMAEGNLPGNKVADEPKKVRA